jgi:diguanylate cyclase (GGDEF)-like protein
MAERVRRPATPPGGIERTGSFPRRRQQDAVQLPTLRVVAGADLLALYTIYPSERVQIGRDRSSNLQLSDPSVSRHHAVLSEVQGELLLEDRGSTNGTSVRGRPVTGPVAVQMGEVFYVGEVALRVDPMTVDEIRHLERLAERLRLVARDPLTGLLGRAWLEEELDAVVDRAHARERSMAALFVDVDHFKLVNDTWGHAAGDGVLREIAGILTSTVRETDRVVRYGGEEFLVVLVDCPKESVLAAAERIRTAIARHGWEVRGHGPTSVTASIGGAALDVDEDARSWLARADEAMYAAKRSGRNRSVVAKARPTA